MADLTTLYRGVGNPFNELIPKSFEGNIGQGRWWSKNPIAAQKYAQGFLESPTPRMGGVVYSMDVDPTKALSKSDKFRNKLIERGYDLFEGPRKGAPPRPPYWNPDVYIATKELIKEGAPKINWRHTLGSNLDALGSRGLGFLKNNAFRTLAMLGSLPAQAGIMTLMPTRMGNAELPLEKMNQQIAQATSNRDRQNIQNIQQHTGEALSDYRMSRPSSERQYTGHGRSGMGRDPRDRMAMGGLINLYRYGGFI